MAPLTTSPDGISRSKDPTNEFLWISFTFEIVNRPVLVIWTVIGALLFAGLGFEFQSERRRLVWSEGIKRPAFLFRLSDEGVLQIGGETVTVGFDDAYLAIPDHQFSGRRRDAIPPTPFPKGQVFWFNYGAEYIWVL
jgi:hypothetical protein